MKCVLAAPTGRATKRLAELYLQALQRHQGCRGQNESESAEGVGGEAEKRKSGKSGNLENGVGGGRGSTRAGIEAVSVACPESADPELRTQNSEPSFAASPQTRFMAAGNVASRLQQFVQEACRRDARLGETGATLVSRREGVVFEFLSCHPANITIADT